MSGRKVHHLNCATMCPVGGSMLGRERLIYHCLLIETDGESWYQLEAVRELDGLPPEILLVPLHGHSHGHSGVAVESDRGGMLHAGDAYFHHDEMSESGPWLIEAFQKQLAVDERARVRNQARLRDLAARTEVDIFCAHDEHEFITHHAPR